MARRRYLSTDISTDRTVNKLASVHGDFAVLLYTWMLPHTLDTGIIETSDPEEVMLMVIPGRRDKTVLDVENALKCIESLGLIHVFDGKIVFPYDSYYKYQSYINSSNRRNINEFNDVKESAFSATNMLEMPQNAEECRKTPQNAASLSLSPSLSPTPTPNRVLVVHRASHDETTSNENQGVKITKAHVKKMNTDQYAEFVNCELVPFRSKEEIARLAKLYPPISVTAEIAKAKDWVLNCIPSKRKTDFKAFIKNWLENAQRDARKYEPIEYAGSSPNDEMPPPPPPPLPWDEEHAQPKMKLKETADDGSKPVAPIVPRP